MAAAGPLHHPDRPTEVYLAGGHVGHQVPWIEAAGLSGSDGRSSAYAPPHEVADGTTDRPSARVSTSRATPGRAWSGGAI